MDTYTRDQKAEAFDGLPLAIKGFLMGDEIISIFQDIGAAYGLNVEKTGILADAITLTILGLLKPMQFTSEIQEHLGVTSDKAGAIAEASEKHVFLRVRELLKNPAPTDTKRTEEVANPTREDMLAEIENPTPFQHPISADHPNGPTPSSLPVITNAPIPTPAPSMPTPTSTPAFIQQAPIPQAPATSATVAHDFIAGKMNEPVSMPPQKYSADPYREPLA
jgi:hypothetical protein